MSAIYVCLLFFFPFVLSLYVCGIIVESGDRGAPVPVHLVAASIHAGTHICFSYRFHFIMYFCLKHSSCIVLVHC